MASYLRYSTRTEIPEFLPVGCPFSFCRDRFLTGELLDAHLIENHPDHCANCQRNWFSCECDDFDLAADLFDTYQGE